MQFTVTSADVQAQARSILGRHLRLHDYKQSCPASTLLAVLLCACARLCSVFAAARRLKDAPSHETVRQALLDNLPDTDEVQRRLNRALAEPLPAAIRRHLRTRRQRGRGLHLAIDLNLRPYHGQADDDPEVVRGPAKSGTTHFHAYATAYLVLRGQRFTLALRRVQKGEKMDQVVRDLLRCCSQLGVPIGLVLLDRGFYSVAVIRYLQVARRPFLMPVVSRGRTPEHPEGASGTRVFQTWQKGGFAQYTLRESGKGGRTARVQIGVWLRYRNGRRGKHGRERLVYAYWGWQPASVRQVSQTYRERFGIETSYRQLGEAKAKTCARSAALRLLLVGVALVLRNIWVWLHHEVLSSPRPGRRKYNWQRLRFKDLLLWLQHEAEKALGLNDEVCTERPMPP
jgi:hypothetical protein